MEGEIYIDPESITILAGIYDLVPGQGIKLNAGNSVSFSATSNTGLWTIETEYPFQISSSKLGFLDDGNYTMIKLDSQLYRKLGDKRYELKNHLGNVHAVITDRKLQVEDTNNLGAVNYYTANVTSYTDYYPFGMEIGSRTGHSSEGYRYGFGGQEKEDEVSGSGNSYTAAFWQYDPRLGRRWNVDPMSFKYPYQSPFSAFNNNPIYFSDPQGLEGEDKNKYNIKKGDTFWDLENKQGLPHGTLQKINPDVDPTKLQIGQEINMAYILGGRMVVPNEADVDETLAVTTGNFTTISKTNTAGRLIYAWQEGIVNGGLRYAEAYYMAQLSYVPFALYNGVRGISYLLKKLPETMAKMKSSQQVTNLFQLLKKAEKSGDLVIQIAKSEDDIAFLSQRGQATFMPGTGLPGEEHMILMLEGANEIVLLEEVIHYQQLLKHGSVKFLNNRTILEIEAQSTLIKMGEKLGWSADEMAQLKHAKSEWEKLLELETKKQSGKR